MAHARRRWRASFLEDGSQAQVMRHHTGDDHGPDSGNIPSANSTGAPYVAGNFAPLKSEVTAFDLEVIGHVPEELTGRFLRIGPNPVDDRTWCV